MPRGRKKGTLAQLEETLHRLNQERAAVIVGIRAAVNHLMNHASADPVPSPGRERRTGVAERRKKRNVSPPSSCSAVAVGAGTVGGGEEGREDEAGLSSVA